MSFGVLAQNGSRARQAQGEEFLDLVVARDSALCAVGICGYAAGR